MATPSDAQDWEAVETLEDFGALFAEFGPEPTWREFARMLGVAQAYE